MRIVQSSNIPRATAYQYTVPGVLPFDPHDIEGYPHADQFGVETLEDDSIAFGEFYRSRHHPIHMAQLEDWIVVTVHVGEASRFTPTSGIGPVPSEGSAELRCAVFTNKKFHRWFEEVE